MNREPTPSFAGDLRDFDIDGFIASGQMSPLITRAAELYQQAKAHAEVNEELAEQLLTQADNIAHSVIIVTKFSAGEYAFEVHASDGNGEEKTFLATEVTDFNDGVEFHNQATGEWFKVPDGEAFQVIDRSL